MRNYAIFLFIAVVALWSCKTKKIANGAIVYKFEINPNAAGALENQLVAYKVTDNTDDFTPTADNLVILDPSTITVDPKYKQKPLHIQAMPGTQGKTLDNYFMGDVGSIKTAAIKFDSSNPIDFPVAKSLPFKNGGLILQALSVPYKIRSKLTGPDFPTPIQSTTETGFSANISLGYKFAQSWFRPSKDVLGLNLNSMSITPGIFTGFGTAALSATNTIHATVVPNRTSLVHSYGFFTLIGVSRFGFGYAGGWDHALGESGGNWVYKGKYWNGFALSIDLINF